jgi:hypothetical protein
LRIPEKLKREIEASAKANSRSITAEIIHRLEQTARGYSFDEGNGIVGEIEELRDRLANLQRYIIDQGIGG